MCVVCVLYEQEKLTRKEAIKAGMEQIRAESLTDEEKHHVFDEVVSKLLIEEMEESREGVKEDD